MGDREATRRELLEVERRGWTSLRDGTADIVYGELMTDDAVMVIANGEIMDRKTVLQALRQAPPRGNVDPVAFARRCARRCRAGP